ncbi:MAG: serine hydrolase domain-containing protein [Bacteroidota bacterium]
MKNLNWILGSMLSWIFITHPSNFYGQNDPDLQTQLDHYLAVQQQRIGFSGVVLISDANGILAQSAIGKASLELDVPMSMEHKFKIASMSKSFTGLLLSLAEQEGKLKLSDSLARFFPQLEDPSWRQITLTQLLGHTSGVPHWAGMQDYWTVKTNLSLSPDQILEAIFQMDLLFPPGSQSAYSSPAYYLLAVVLEQVYQSRYETLLREKIVAPLSLINTQVCDGRAIIPGLCEGYHLLNDDSLVQAPYRNMAMMKGGGNLYSDARDVNQWCRSFLDAETWGADIQTRSLQAVSDMPMPHKKGDRYARGWYIRGSNQRGPWAYHIGGGTYGFSSKAAIYPDSKLSLVILSNVSFLPMDDVLWRDLEKLAFKQAFRMPAAFPDVVQLSPHTLSEYAGIYRANNGRTLQLLFHQNQLFAKLGPAPPFQIYAYGHDVLFGKKVEVRFRFLRDEAGQLHALETRFKGREDHFVKELAK